jgi:hypothetical protein
MNWLIGKENHVGTNPVSMKRSNAPQITKSVPALVVILAMLPWTGIAGEMCAVFAEGIDRSASEVRKGSDFRGSGVTLDSGAGVTIRADKAAILFSEVNKKQGELLTIDNLAGQELMLKIELPTEGLLYSAVIRVPERTKVPQDSWDQVVVPANCGVLILLIPEQDSTRLGKLDGAEISIKVYEANNEPLETLRIPIEVASEPKASSPKPFKRNRGGQ